MVLDLFKEIKKQDNNWLLFLKLEQKIKDDFIELEPNLKKQLQAEMKSLQRVKCQGYAPFKMGQEF